MSTRLQWLRLWSDAVDDEKLRLLAFEDRWHFIAILCCKAQGVLDDGGDMMRRKVAVKLGLQVRELEEVGRRLAEVGIIDADTLQPIAWDKRQFRSDVSTDRVRRFRGKQDTKRSRNVSETPPETETDTEKENTKTRAPARAREGKPRATPRTPVSGFALPAGVDPGPWEDFVKFRAELRKPLTASQMVFNAKKLGEMSLADQRLAVDNSIRSGWMGLFPPKGSGAVSACSASNLTYANDRTY